MAKGNGWWDACPKNCDTWELVTPPPSVRLVACRCVFTNKNNLEGFIDKLQSMCCHKGFT